MLAFLVCAAAWSRRAVLASALSAGTAVTTEQRAIRYYGAVDTPSLLDLNAMLLHMDAEAPDQVIDLHVQSAGGELLPALYTADLIAGSTAPVHTHVDGWCASAATLLTVPGARRHMSAHSVFMVHQLSTAHEGTYGELQQSARNDRLLMAQLVDLYVQHSKLSKRALVELLARDEYLSKATCLRYGFVDA